MAERFLIADCRLPIGVGVGVSRRSRVLGVKSQIPRTRSRTNAFTLIELVVTISLLGLVAAGSGAILLQANRARNRANSAELVLADVDRALNDLSRALRNRVRTVEDDEVLFEGISSEMGETPADRIRFFTIDPGTIRLGEPQSDVCEVEYMLDLDEATQKPTLLKRTDPTLNLQPDGGGVIDRLAELMSLNITYFNGLAWQDDWPVEFQSYPMAVRLQATVFDAARKKPITLNRLVTWPYGEAGDGASMFESGGTPGQTAVDDATNAQGGGF